LSVLGPRAAEPPASPLDLQLQERVATQLVQIDVTLHGPAESLWNLTAKDFTLVVGGRTVEDLVLARTCPASPTPTPDTPRAPAAPKSGRPPGADGPGVEPLVPRLLRPAPPPRGGADPRARDRARAHSQARRRRGAHAPGLERTRAHVLLSMDERCGRPARRA